MEISINKYQRLVKYQSPFDSLSNLIIFLNIELNNNNEIFINKTYIEKKKFDSLARKIIRGSDIHFRDYPFVKITKNRISQKELGKIAKDLSIDDFTKIDRNWISRINDKLADKAIFRDNIAFKIIDYKNRAIIYNFVDKWKRTEAKNENLHINYCFQNDDKIKLRMFNVGQANCSCLYVNNTLHTVFDLGDFRHNISLLKTIKEADNFDIVISHFDNDHINASKRLFRKAKNNVTLYFPNWEQIRNLNANAQFLLLGACVSNYTLVPLSLISSQMNDVRGVNVFQGVPLGNSPIRISERNARCLISQINHGRESILIPGDSLYFNFPTTFQPTKMIIPHHGCYYEGETSLPNINLGKLKETFVFCGPSRKYSHPNVTHIKRFLNSSRDNVFRFKNKKVAQNVIYDGKHAKKGFEDFTTQIDSEYFDWHI